MRCIGFFFLLPTIPPLPCISLFATYLYCHDSARNTDRPFDKTSTARAVHMTNVIKQPSQSDSICCHWLQHIFSKHTICIFLFDMYDEDPSTIHRQPTVCARNKESKCKFNDTKPEMGDAQWVVVRGQKCMGILKMIGPNSIHFSLLMITNAGRCNNVVSTPSIH